jgi:hypothetical protein
LAAPWVSKIPDDQQRFNVIENVARNWLQTDAQAARAWLNQLNMPAERKEMLLRSSGE